MVNWSEIILIFAITFWLLSTLLGQLLKWLRDWISRSILGLANQCQALCWEHDAMKTLSSSVALAADTFAWTNTGEKDPPGPISATKTFLGLFDITFAARPVRTERQQYLEERKKIHTH